MRNITYKNETKSLAEWSVITGLGAGTIAKRLDANWTVEQALTQPLGGKRTRSRRRTPSLAGSLPALSDWQRDMHTAHRQMTRSIRLFVREMESQMADLRYQLDKNVDRGVVESTSRTANDRTTPVAQDRV